MTKKLTNAVLEPTTIEPITDEPSVIATGVATRAPGPEVAFSRITSDELNVEEITKSPEIHGKKPGLFGRSFQALRAASFQVGLSLPGKFWYRESRNLNAREMSAMDAVMRGFL